MAEEDKEWTEFLKSLVSDRPTKTVDPRFVEELPPHLKQTYSQDARDPVGAINQAREVLKPTPVQSAVGGTLQGATFGHADEIMGAVEAPFSGRPYAEIRDEHRMNFDNQKAANPRAFLAGQVGGGVVGGVAAPMGPLANIAGKAGLAARGAATGATAGAGYSEGETLKEVGHDAAKAGAIGAAIGPALGFLGERIVGRAAPRQDARVFRELGRMGTAPQKGQMERVGAQKVAETAKQFGIMSAPDKRIPVQQGLTQVGQSIGQKWHGFDQAGAHRPLGALMDKTEKLRQELSTTTTGQKLGNAVHEKMKEIWALYGGDKAAKVPLSALNKEIHDLEAIGFAGGTAGKLSEEAKAVLSRRVAGALNDELETGIAEAVKANPALGGAATELKELNNTFRSLKVIDAVVKRNEATKPFQQTAGEKFAKNPIQYPLSVVAEGARNVGRGLDAVTIKAQQAAQAVGKEYPDAVHVIEAARQNGAIGISQPVVDSLVSGDREQARKAFMSEIFGQ